jgi:hypothetical protein
MVAVAETATGGDILAEVIELAWDDDGFRAQLLENPKEALRQTFDIEVPDHMRVRVMEEGSDDIVIVLPARPLEAETDSVLVPPAPFAGTNISANSGCHQCCTPPGRQTQMGK